MQLSLVEVYNLCVLLQCVCLISCSSVLNVSLLQVNCVNL